MSILSNLRRQIFQGVLGQSLALIVGIVTILIIIYIFSWARSGGVVNSLSVYDAQCHVDTVQQGGYIASYWFVDDYKPAQIQIHPALAAQPSVHRLLQQISRLRTAKLEHINYFEFFYRMRYSMSMVQSIVSLLAVVLGLIITREGWGSAKPIELVTFFVLSATAGLLQLMPETMHLEDNISSNTSKYVSYQALEDEALTYLSTHLSQDEDSLELGSFIVYMDYRISNVHEVTLKLGDFPAQKIQEKLEAMDKRLKKDAKDK